MAIDAINQASTTITTAINPQLAEFQRQLSDSEGSIAELQSLAQESQTALSISDINQVSLAYTNLKNSGLLHNATDLQYLMNGIQAGAQAIEAILQDATIKLAICKAP